MRMEAVALIERQIRELSERHKVRPVGEEPLELQIDRYRDSADLLVLEAIKGHLTKVPQ
jgi:hypothetical protein